MVISNLKTMGKALMPGFAEALAAQAIGSVRVRVVGKPSDLERFRCATNMRFARDGIYISVALATFGIIKTVQATKTLDSADNETVREQRREWQSLWATVAACGVLGTLCSAKRLYTFASLFQRATTSASLFQRATTS